MIQLKAISGAPEYIETELATLINAGWEIIDLSTNLYDSTAGMRHDTTVYLKRTVVQP